MPPLVVLYLSGSPIIMAVNLDSAIEILYANIFCSFRCLRLVIVFFIFSSFLVSIFWVVGFGSVGFGSPFGFIPTFFAQSGKGVDELELSENSP